MWAGGWLAVVLLCGGAIPGWAQYRFDHWTADNGLPQNSVRDIVQTRDGYLWLTTFDGLVRFDGVRFTVFNKSNSPGIVTNRFLHLYEDAKGDLWASAEGGIITRLHAGVFTTYGREHGLAGDTLVLVGGDGQGRLLTAAGEHLLRWAEGRFEPADDSRMAGPPSEALERGHHLPFYSNHKDISIGFLEGRWQRWMPTVRIIGRPRQDQAGRIWFGSVEGVQQFSNGTLIPADRLGKGISRQPSILVEGHQPLQALSTASDGSLWLSEIETGRSELVSRQPPEGCRDVAEKSGRMDIFVVYGDREDNLWIGTFDSGLFRVRKQALRTLGKAEGLPENEVYPLLEDRAGTVWVGTQNSGAYRLEAGRFNLVDKQTTARVSTSLFEDRAGGIWVNGRLRFEKGRGVPGLHPATQQAEIGEIWTMHEEPDGTLWIGTDKGVLRYRNGTVTPLTVKDGLAGDDTKVIIEDGQGGLWLGSYGGLTHYKDGRFQRWTEKDGLPGNTVRALYQDREGALWIGTYDSGLGRFKDGKFTRYTLRDGLFDNGVFQFLEDDYGWCWMSSNRGLYRVRKQELVEFAEGRRGTITSIAYGKGDGMQSVECNGGRWPAGFKARDGRLWFPTMGGIVVVDPAKLSTNNQPPSVVIETMHINNEAVAVDLGNALGRNPATAVEIRPGQENFEIAYTALSFINSENIRFKYKLEGLDEAWVDTGTRRTAYFSHVAPGTYTFKVIAANSDGIWNMEGQRLRIVVRPPFYRTWWFVTLSVMSVMGAVFAAYKYRIRQVERLQVAQQAFARQLIESQEAERKRIAAELHDSLGQHLSVINNLALLWLHQHADDDGEPMRKISATTMQAIREVKEISYNLRPHQLGRIGLTKAIEALLKKAEQASGIRFVAALDDLRGALPPETDINFYRIVQECVNNILKHSEATEATVTIRREADRLRLTIRDNGKGFTPGGEGSGFGLLGIRERAQLLGGQAVIQSAPGQGTTTTLEIVPNSKA